MGKKKKKIVKPWCYYCDREFDDEKILIQHQKAKHFKCHVCHKKLSTAGGMVVHILQVHKENISKVPNAKAGRDSTELEIFGMEGIPADVLASRDAANDEDEKPAKVQRVEVPTFVPTPPGMPMYPGPPSFPPPGSSPAMGMQGQAYPSWQQRPGYPPQHMQGWPNMPYRPPMPPMGMGGPHMRPPQPPQPLFPIQGASRPMPGPPGTMPSYGGQPYSNGMPQAGAAPPLGTYPPAPPGAPRSPLFPVAVGGPPASGGHSYASGPTAGVDIGPPPVITKPPPQAAAPSSEVYLVWDDEAMSMEERRASLPMYQVVDEAAQMSDVEAALERRIKESKLASGMFRM